jgi:CRISPR-associated protein Csy3
LGSDHDTLKLSFSLKILSGVENPSACNSAEFAASYKQAANSYIETEGFTELAKRYATNIANGRFLWRNRVGAERIEVVVTVCNEAEKQTWIFDAKSIDLKHFDTSNPDITALADKIAAVLSGKSEFLMLAIDAYAQIGLAQDVYPSEELVLDKGNSKTKKSKILYHIDGVAGMHSQKIGNALRTIDTWYPIDEDNPSIGPIAVEPYGAVTNLGKAYRTPKAKADFYTLFDRFARGENLVSKNDEHFVMAVLVRGGVFGESGKD